MCNKFFKPLFHLLGNYKDSSRSAVLKTISFFGKVAPYNIYMYIYIYRNIILPVVLYGCKTWSLILREEQRLRVFENMVLRWVFEPKRDEVTGEWRKLRNKEHSDLYSLPNIVRVVKSRRKGWTGTWCVWEREEGCTGSWWGNLRERDHWGDPDVDGMIILR